MKRGLVFAVLFFVILISSFGVYAQETGDSDLSESVSDEGDTITDSEAAESGEDEEFGVLAEGSEANKEEEIILEEQDFEKSENVDSSGSIDFEDESAELNANEGITPDSAFYFIDEFFDRFGNDLNNREEKVAEVRAMIEEGNFDAARKSLERYRGYADDLEREVSPDERQEARRSAAAIRNVLTEIQDEIPDEFEDDFFEDVLDRESRIVAAAEVAERIRGLCRELSDLSPQEFHRVCKIDDDSPQWQRELFEDLSSEQETEAKEFFDIMTQCFETSGRECRCEDISITEFSETCSVARPLAVECEVNDNEAACEQLDAVTEEIEDSLPPHLLRAFEAAEDRFEDVYFENYGGPRECEGISDKAECEERIFEKNSPVECAEEFRERGLEFNRDFGIGEARELCEEIMFRLNAPPECVEAGATNPRDCARISFQANAPQECLDAGLTGESKNDARECQRLMESFEEDREERGFAFGNCVRIENPEERLRCFDSALGRTDNKRGHFEDEEFREEFKERFRDNFRERFEETKERQRMCVQRCTEAGGAWDFSDGECNCHFDEGREEFDREGFEEDRERFEGGEFDDDFDEFDEFRDDFDEEEFGEFENSGTEFSENTDSADGGSDADSSINSDSGQESFSNDGSNTNSGSFESSGSDSGEGSSESEAGITGGVIFNNDFFRYYFK